MLHLHNDSCFLPTILSTVKKGGRNHSLFILNGLQTNTTQRRPTPKSIK